MTARRELAERGIPALGLISPPPIHVQTPTFEGSLATLFRCVKERKVDLLDIPLFPICEAYFAYLMHGAAQDLDEAAAALAALGYLLERKAWSLLPVLEPEPEFEEPLELPEPTSHEYRSAIEALQFWQAQRSLLFFRSPEMGPDPYELPYTLGNVSIADLALAFERIIRKAIPDVIEPTATPRKSLAEQMRRVLLAISYEFKSLLELIPEDFTRTDAVYWFLSLLELVRLGQVSARKDEDEVRFGRS